MPSNLVKKLAEIMSEVGHVAKRGVNEALRYKYVMEADLCNEVRDKLSKRGLIMVPSVEFTQRRLEKITNKRGETYEQLVTDVMVKYSIMDSESGEKIEFNMPGSAADSGDKGIYKALTGSDKYAIMKLFLIPTGDDPEGDADTDARADGFRQGTKEERQAIVDAKLKELNEKVEMQKKQGTARESHNEPGAGPKKLITKPQAGRLYAIAKSHGWSDQDIKDVLAHWKPIGFQHTREVWKEQYDAICKFFESGENQPPAQEEVTDEDIPF